MSLVATRRKMKKVTGVIGTAVFVAIFIAGIFASFSFNSQRNSDRQAERSFATISGKPVSNREFEQILQQFRQFATMGRGVTAQQQSMFPQQAYEELLREYATANAANAYGIKLSTEEARAEAEKQVDQQLDQIAQGATSAEKAQYRQQMLAGQDVEGERRRLLAQRLQEKLTQDARPVEVKVAHVLIKTDKRTPEQALQLAQEIARRARAGEDFARLAKQYSEDPGSKDKGGEVGWASASPARPDPKKPDPEAATNFVPEFTAAALYLKPGQISDPVHSSFGYHVIKALRERPYEPKDTQTPSRDAKGAKGAEGKNDPKKRQEAIDTYKQDWTRQVFQGLESDYKNRLSVVPQSDWLKGYLMEQQVNPFAPPTTPAVDAAARTQAQKKAEQIVPIVDSYSAAQKSNDPASGAGLTYKIGQLSIWAGQWYARAGQETAATHLFTQAKELLQKQADRYRDADLYMLLGNAEEQFKDKTAALEAYKRTLDRARTDTGLLSQLQEKFKALGHPELAAQADDKQKELLRQQAEQQKQQQEAMKKIADQRKQSQDKGAATPGAGGQGKVVDTVTVKTGAIDPKTGKPKIVSVTHGGPEGANSNAPAANAPPPKP